MKEVRLPRDWAMERMFRDLEKHIRRLPPNRSREVAIQELVSAQLWARRSVEEDEQPKYR